MNNNVNRCKHVFKNGPHKGQMCYKCCTGNLCRFHSKNVKTGKVGDAEYVDKENERYRIKVSDKDNVLRKKIKMRMECEDITRQELNESIMHLKRLEDICSYYVRMYHGYACRIDPDHKIPIRKKILREMESKQFRDDCMAEYEELDEQSQQDCDYFEGYLKQSKEDYLLFPNTYINVIHYSGSIANAEKKMKEVAEKYQECRQLIIKLRKFINKNENRIREERIKKEKKEEKKEKERKEKEKDK